jgi:hypothetical protein
MPIFPHCRCIALTTVALMASCNDRLGMVTDGGSPTTTAAGAASSLATTAASKSASSSSLSERFGVPWTFDTPDGVHCIVSPFSQPGPLPASPAGTPELELPRHGELAIHWTPCSGDAPVEVLLAQKGNPDLNEVTAGVSMLCEKVPNSGSWDLPAAAALPLTPGMSGFVSVVDFSNTGRACYQRWRLTIR